MLCLLPAACYIYNQYHVCEFMCSKMGWLSRWSYPLFCLQLVLLHSLTLSKLCSHDQVYALLQFKQLFTYYNDTPPYNVCGSRPTRQDMKHWKEDTDCCSWDGVTCDDMDTGHVTELDLSCNQLNGTIPSNTTLFLLPYLQFLDLSGNNHLKGSFPEANWNNPLKSLDVSYTSFSGRLPNSIDNLKFLTELNLQHCKFIELVPASIGNLTHLEYLDLSHNNFSGNIPSSLSNLQNLSSLDLSVNNFIGEIPEIFVNLTQLDSLDLSSNQLSGPIPSCLSGLQNLDYMQLNENSLTGTIPSSLFALPLLTEIDLSFNQLVAIQYIGENSSNSLRSIYLDNNRFHGSIPSSIFVLVTLERISFSSNNLSGNLEPYMFAKLKCLQNLDLSSNNFSGNLEPYVFANLTTLEDLDLSHNSLSLSSTIKVNSSFEAPRNLQRLHLSDNKIHGKIPNWLCHMGKDTLEFLNVSHNFLTGSIEQLPHLPHLKFLDLRSNLLPGKLPVLPWNNLTFLDLSSNLLQGKLPVLPLGLYTLLISKNQLTGEIPHCICNMSDLMVLDLSNNNMSGTIPECMGTISRYLKVIDLQNNSFSDTIPDTFALNNDLETLNFNNNDLEGPVPRSLVNCTALQVLDLGNNKINDTFPHWLGILPDLQVLVLRSNKFSGSVRASKVKNSFSKLRILDLSKNNFSGSLSMKFFGKLKAMMDVGEAGTDLQYMGIKGINSHYQYSIVVTMKGVDIHMEKILTIFTTMDLSSNKFHGQIPDAVGKLEFLKVLNFSHNDLIGHIPSSLENLIELESLDLSSNRLEGEIPNQLTNLTFLSTLNLSYNQLVGHIPQGNQFGTFQNNSYIGNLGLCDFPLSEKCNNCEEPECKPDTPTIFHDEHNTASWFDWKMSLMGYGCGVVIGLSTGYIVFSTGKPEWIVNMVDRKQSRRVRRLTGRGRRRN